MKLKANRRSFYLYRCKGCGNDRRSVLYLRAAEEKTCRNCKREMPPRGMKPLFDLDGFLERAEEAGKILDKKIR